MLGNHGAILKEFTICESFRNVLQTAKPNHRIGTLLRCSQSTLHLGIERWHGRTHSRCINPTYRWEPLGGLIQMSFSSFYLDAMWRNRSTGAVRPVVPPSLLVVVCSENRPGHHWTFAFEWNWNHRDRAWHCTSLITPILSSITSRKNTPTAWTSSKHACWLVLR